MLPLKINSVLPHILELQALVGLGTMETAILGHLMARPQGDLMAPEHVRRHGATVPTDTAARNRPSGISAQNDTRSASRHNDAKTASRNGDERSAERSYLRPGNSNVRTAGKTAALSRRSFNRCRHARPTLGDPRQRPSQRLRPRCPQVDSPVTSLG